MDKKELAEEIREIEFNKKKKNKYKISSFSDEQVIINYITCSCCGNIPVDEEDMENIIRIAHNAEQFYVLCSFVESMRYEEYGGDEEGDGGEEDDYEEED